MILWQIKWHNNLGLFISTPNLMTTNYTVKANKYVIRMPENTSHRMSGNTSPELLSQD